MLGLRGLEEGLAGTYGPGVVRVSVEGIGPRQVGGGARKECCRNNTMQQRAHKRFIGGEKPHKVASE